jgi:hypothetical protein
MEGKISPHPDPDGKSTPVGKCLEILKDWNQQFLDVTLTKMYDACFNSSN